MSQVEQTLDQAYRLIENNQLAEAERLLEGLLPQNEANPDVWWLMAHATQDAKRGKEALRKASALAPDREDVQHLLEQSQADKKPAARRLFPVLLILAFIVGFALIALTQAPNTSAPTPVAQAVATTEVTQDSSRQPAQPTDKASVQINEDNPTPQPTDEVSLQTPEGLAPTPTLEFVPSETPTPESLLSIEVLASDLPQITFADEPVRLTQENLTIYICSLPGPEASQAIDILLNYFSRREDVFLDAQTLEISLNDCIANLEVRAVAVDRESLQAFGAGGIDQSELLRRVQPIR